MLPRVVLSSWNHIILPPQPVGYLGLWMYHCAQFCDTSCMSFLLSPLLGTVCHVHTKDKQSSIKRPVQNKVNKSQDLALEHPKSCYFIIELRGFCLSTGAKLKV